MEVIKKIFDRLIKLGEWLRKLNFVKKIIQIKSVLQEQIILRKMIFFSVLFGSWLILVVAGLTSSNRQVYSEDELSTEQNFANGTGSVKLASQTYSKKDRLILLDFELNGQAGSGINPRNLKWKLYSKKARNSKLEVVPIYDKKVMVMIKNVPEDFLVYSGEDAEALSARVLGGQGIISVASHIYGDNMKTMYSSLESGDVSMAGKIMRDLIPKAEALFSYPSPSPVKAALNKIGYNVGGCRLPIVSLDKNEENELFKKLKI